MDSNTRELLDLLFRWLHLIAGIMWIGNSMLFNWLDRNLVMPDQPKEGLIGEMWMVHSGGFYQVEKKFLAPSQMPRILHWFKWQAYTTWMSGVALLIVVYYMGQGAFLVDPGVANLSANVATAIGVGVIAGGFLFYDLLWRSPIGRNDAVAIALSIAIGALAVFVSTRFLSGRAAYIHVGAMMGTVMAGNVFFHIIPSQRELVAATKAGKAQDKAIGAHAKQRSIHNNYMTFPLLFLMLSNHFSFAYGHRYNWLILAILIVSGGLVRHFMNIRFTFRRWIPALAATITLGVAALYAVTQIPPAKALVQAPVDLGEKVPFKSVSIVINQRCIACHSAKPTDNVFTVPPNNVMFDSPEQIKTFAERIKARVVVMRTMPLMNKTGMTDDERDLLWRWYSQGASIQ